MDRVNNYCKMTIYCNGIEINKEFHFKNLDLSVNNNFTYQNSLGRQIPVQLDNYDYELKFTECEDTE